MPKDNINSKEMYELLSGLIAAQVAQKLKDQRDAEQAKYQRVIAESNDNRNRQFFMYPELIQAEMLQELKKIRKLLERKA